MDKIIRLRGLPDEYQKLVKELVGLFRKNAKSRSANFHEREVSRPIPKEIILNGLTETERDFVTSLVRVFRARMRKESEACISRPMGAIGDISRASIYEEYLDHKFPKLPDTKDNNT